ncbi:predicted protein [Uncinocarpus reesii 1704]|uniref:Uncharacterized protein n=1 Tax=Uncinocarpus reesii (strain UAMH 1704) TaxID=336963 RepID=C4JED4_UNCRE|nr:uncharacterized protein UREG_00773 [Uncinocarpus reesii 1704]EEP75926.1 predicted protein [Uncinocarpus reesii 1704]
MAGQLAYLEKPPLPYVPGQRFTVRAHSPLSLLPPKRGEYDLSPEANKERERLSPLQRCLLHPPNGGSFGESTVEFEISHGIRHGKDHFSQIVAVNILATSSKSPKALQNVTNAVAKIYDPLYIDHFDDDHDPFVYVERGYATKVAVYKRLASLQGTVIPILYGSYALDLPIDGSTRSVRLILMEHVQGLSMMYLKP